MFLPLRDAPNPVGLPLINYLLIAANVGVFFAITLPLGGAAPNLADPALLDYIQFLSQEYGRTVHPAEVLANVSAYDVFVFEHGFRPAQGSMQTMFTSMFLHGGFLHLAGNMLFLWIYGDNVEHRLGRVRYLCAYLGAGVAATLLHAVFDLSSNVPMVGASGAISGVLGFYFLLFPRNTVEVFVALFPFLVDVVTIPARIVLGAYLIIDNVFPVLFSGGGSVAHGAHIGGFLAGLGAAWWLERGGPGPPPRRPRSSQSGGGKVHEGPGFGRRANRDGASNRGPAAEISRLVESGAVGEAAQVYFTHEETIEPAPGDALVIGQWLNENGHPTAALTVFRRVIKAVPRGPQAAWAHLGAGLVQWEELGRPTAAYQHFLDTIDLDPHGDAATIARGAIATIDGTPQA